MFKSALLLINGNYAQDDIQKNIEPTAGILASHIEEVVIRQTQYKGHTEKICKEAGNQYEAIFIIGGDGTLHECVNGLADLDNPPVTGILPGGTCNDFSRSLQIPQPLKRAAETLIKGQVRYLDIGKMNDRYFLNFYGIGLIAETSENINENLKGVFGKVSYFISALQMVNNTRPFSFTLETKEQTVEGEAVMVLISNGNVIGTNKLPFQNNVMDDGEFDIFIISEGGAALLREYFNAKNPFAWEADQSDIQHYRSSYVRLETPQPMKADTDGELYMKTPVTINNLHQKLPFLIPNE
ncbi:diacylglycerol/lipid kinase family protein [Alteribacillus bidgolensis]|uniref:Lipid kinase, YegS/Rv2252/BmrU family n=1 Tax=Alteribacillus bidgolensis TaxID=930129 RepID=A0A1G8L422_9BACI|nr:diacylglycerol kinase family protein [Alteribacillus bidgolensis]SDI50463.1 lipid kinase, YegS/Rv2252/BmrU family [Alteribacillus bidgolensis]